MIRKFTAMIDAWQATLPNGETSKLFVKVLYLFTLLNFFRLLPVADHIWGQPHFIILRDLYENGFGHYAMLLNHPEWRSVFRLFLLPGMFILFFGVFGLSTLLSRMVLWFLFVNLNFGNPEVSNGGWHLLHHMLLLSIFLFRVEDELQTRVASLKRLLHNLAFYGIWVQVSLVYMVAGSHKLLGQSWPNGEALAYILSFKEYTLPFAHHTEGNNLLLMLGTWSVLLYQLLFPFMIWIKRVRGYWLAAGLVFHLSIAFVIGIVDFGLIMAASYVIFLDPRKAQRVNVFLEGLSRKSKRIRMAPIHPAPRE